MKSKLLIFIFLVISIGLWGQTNPTPQNLPFSQNFSTFNGNSTTYPDGFQGWTIAGSLSTSYPATAPNGNQALSGGTNSTTTAGVYDMVGKMGILSTGNAMRAICLAINTTGYNSITVTYTAATQRTENTRLNGLGLQYRIGTTGTFTDVSLSEYQNQMNPTNTTGTDPVKVETISVTLPPVCDNQSVVQLRWLIRDISGSGNRPSFSIDNIVINGNIAIPNITLYDNNQITDGDVEQGATNHILSRFRVNVTAANATLNQISFTSGGTFVAGDILNFKLYTSTLNTFPGGTPLSTVSATTMNAGATVTFGSLNQTCAVGDRYFWITADITGPATVGNTVNVPSLSASNFTFASGNVTGTISAGGTQTIIACTTPTNITGLTLTPGNTQITVAWTNPTCYDEVMIVAKASSSITDTPTGDGTAYTANLTFGSGTPFDGGYVVYKGILSPQTILGLTNEITYYVRVFTRKGTIWTSGVEDNTIPQLFGYYWNGGNTSANPAAGGSGTWSATNAWRQPTASGSQATWTNGNNAILVGTAGTITLSGDVTHTGLYVKTTGYSITPDGTTTRTLTGNIILDDNIELRFNDLTSTSNRTIAVAGNISGGSNSSIALNVNQTGTNTSRINLAANGATLDVPINIYTGATSSNFGNFAIVGTAPNTVMTAAATITNNTLYRTTLGSTSGNSLTVNSVVSGSADLMFAAGSSGGAGTITLNAAMAYTGSTIFNAANSGVIRLGMDNALPVSTNVTMGFTSGNGGIFDLNGYNQTFASISNGPGGGLIRNNGTSPSILTINGTSNTTFSLPIENGTGGLSLVKGGTGNLELTGQCTYQGLTTINGGQLILNRAGGGTLPNGNNIVVNSGGQLVIKTNQTLNNLTVNSGGTLTLTDNATLTINGTFTLHEDVTLLQGNLTIASGGNLVISAGKKLFIYNNKILTINENVTIDGTISTDNSGILTVASGKTLTINGTLDLYNSVTINGTLNIASGGTLLLDTGDVLTINGGLLLNENTELNGDLTIATGGSAEITAGKNLTVNGLLTNNGTLTLRSNASGTASLIHYNNDVPAVVERYIPGASEDWHLLSSPVENQPISGSFTPSGTYPDGTGYDFYAWDEPNTIWRNQKNSNNNITHFVPGKGYLVAYQATNPTLTFSGELNAGIVDFPMTTDGTGGWNAYNLAGNPYPCAIDWKASLGWDRTNLEVSGGGYSMWIWNDAVGQYGSYNSASVSNTGTHGTSRYIAPMQGFFVKASAAGNLSMNADVKVHNNQDFLKADELPMDYLHLRVTSPDVSYSDEVIVEFHHESDQGGARKLMSFFQKAPALYIPKNGIFYSIDFRSAPREATVIPLSFRAGVNGTYTLQALTIESFAPGVTITLEDRKTGTLHPLHQNPAYTFTASTGDSHDRFLLHFAGAFGVEEPLHEPGIHIYSYDRTIYLNSPSVQQALVSLYRINGQQVFSRQITLNGTTTIPVDLPGGWYVVRVITNGTASSRKVFIW